MPLIIVIAMVVFAGACAPRPPAAQPPPPPPTSPASVDPDKESRVLDVILTYQIRLGLPAGAEYSAELIDVSDGTAGVLAKNRKTTGGSQPPLRLTLAYDASRVHRDHRYAVHAEIVYRDALWFSGTTTLVPPLPTETRVSLIRSH